jgi:hypothetical protein
MTGEQLSVLIGELTPALAQRREQSRHARRGHQRRRAAGAGAKDSLSAADRILATVLYGRQLGTHALMAELFGVTRSTLTRALQDVQPLLAERGPLIPPSTARFRTPADVRAFLNLRATHPKIEGDCSGGCRDPDVAAGEFGEDVEGSAAVFGRGR